MAKNDKGQKKDDKSGQKRKLSTSSQQSQQSSTQPPPPKAPNQQVQPIANQNPVLVNQAPEATSVQHEPLPSTSSQGWQVVQRGKSGNATESTLHFTQPNFSSTPNHSSNSSKFAKNKGKGKKSYANAARPKPDGFWHPLLLKVYKTNHAMNPLTEFEWEPLHVHLAQTIFTAIPRGENPSVWVVNNTAYNAQQKCGFIDCTPASFINIKNFINNTNWGMSYRAWSADEKPAPVVKYFVPEKYNFLPAREFTNLFTDLHKDIPTIAFHHLGEVPVAKGRLIFVQTKDEILQFLQSREWKLQGPLGVTTFDVVTDLSSVPRTNPSNPPNIQPHDSNVAHPAPPQPTKAEQPPPPAGDGEISLGGESLVNAFQMADEIASPAFSPLTDEEKMGD